MPLPNPVSVDDPASVKVTIAHCTNSHLRALVIKYDAKRNQTLPLTEAEAIWANIAWVWANHRAEAENTFRKHIQADNLDEWLLAQYDADVAMYKGQPVPDPTPVKCACGESHK